MSDREASPAQILGGAERGHVLEIFSALDRHLAHWNPERVDLEISVKNHGGREQKVTLEA